MSTAVAEVEAAVEAKVEKRAEAPAEQRVVLHNISWELFEQMLEELGDHRNCRLAYNEGDLEIMSPLRIHEHFNRFLNHIIFTLSRELHLNLLSLGSLTCKRKDLLRGIEPDSCFYIQNEPSVRKQKEINLRVDPPPDLMIEVDISRSSMNKMPILAALGVPEFWRCHNDDQISIFKLEGGSYVETDKSPAFGEPPLKTVIPRFFAMAREEGEIAAVAAFEKWVREELSKR